MTDDELRVLLASEGKGAEEIEIVVQQTKSVRAYNGFTAIPTGWAFADRQRPPFLNR